MLRKATPTSNITIIHVGRLQGPPPDSIGAEIPRELPLIRGLVQLQTGFCINCPLHLDH